MKKKIMVMACCLWVAGSGLSFAEEKMAPDPQISALEHADKKARFKRGRDAFNHKVNKRIRAKKLAQKEIAAAKKKAEEEKDKGEGSFKVEF